MYFTDKSSSSVASFELTLVVYTAEYYEIPQGQQIIVSVLLWSVILSLYIYVFHQLADLKELSFVKVCIAVSMYSMTCCCCIIICLVSGGQ